MGRLHYVKSKDMIFYIGYSFMIIYKFSIAMPIFEGTLFRTYSFLFSGMILVLLSVLLDRFSLLEIVLISYGFLSFFLVKDITLMTCLVLIIAIRDKDIEQIISFYYHIQSFVLMICIILYPIFYIAGLPYAKSSIIAGRFRYNFFFTHPNNFAIQVVFTILAYIETILCAH